MPDISLRSSVASSQISAEQDLRAALSYLDDAEQPFFDKKRVLTYDDVPRLFECLGNAALHVASARNKDRDQVLIVEDERAGPITYTQDNISAAISYREGQVALLLWRTALVEEKKHEALTRARAALQKSVSFSMNPTYYLSLADVCRLLGDKRSASDYINTALVIDHNFVEAIKLKSEIEALPDKRYSETTGSRRGGPHPLLIAFLVGIACWGLGALLAWNSSLYGPSGFAVILMIIGVILTIGTPAFLIFAVVSEASSYRKYEDYRIREDMAKSDAERYERRYQGKNQR